MVLYSDGGSVIPRGKNECMKNELLSREKCRREMVGKKETCQPLRPSTVTLKVLGRSHPRWLPGSVSSGRQGRRPPLIKDKGASKDKGISLAMSYRRIYSLFL